MLGDMEIAAQHTLKTSIGCRGVGLHGGQKVTMTLRPAPPDSGIVFRRVDAGVDIRAHWTNTVDSALCTVLSNREGVRVGTIEHLMAALAGAEIDNAIVEIDGPEVPIMDGSAAPFVFLIECAGRAEQDAARRAFKILKPVWVREDGVSAALLPDHGFAMSFEIDFDNPLIRRQDMMVAVDSASFKAELSRARTFGLLDDVTRLQAAGLARGGSLDNAVVVSGDRILNTGGLRYADEFVRHKLLDAFGDLFLAGGPIIGQFRGMRSGHAHTRRVLAALFADPDAWCETTIARPLGFGAPDWNDQPAVARA
ncbi:MAG: UDP-3-O-acyl-N-acetylglucosamine deacetylase [Alphaproteobacteria bacterium]|nr:UDP-3-O-acyl-N-acetylglucosamine deacetylase [Alphaproteobacteria bacterium]